MLLKNLLEDLPSLAKNHYDSFGEDIPKDASDEMRHCAYEAFQHVYISAYITLKYGSNTDQTFEWHREEIHLDTLPLRMEAWNSAAGRRVGEYYNMLWWDIGFPGVIGDTNASDELEELILEMARQIFNKIWGIPSEEEKQEYKIPDSIHIVINYNDSVIAANDRKIIVCAPEYVICDNVVWNYSMRPHVL